VGGGVEIEHKSKILPASLRSGVGASRKEKAFNRKDRKKGAQRRRSENPHPNVAKDATLRMGHPRFIAAQPPFLFAVIAIAQKRKIPPASLARVSECQKESF
jgi:hypothetical protein